MVYRKSAEEPLPDIIGRSTRRAALLLAGIGLVCIAFGAFTFFTTVLFDAMFVSYAVAALGLAFELAAIVFYLRNR